MAGRLSAAALAVLASVGSLCVPAAAEEARPTVTDVRVVGDDQRLRFILDATSKIDVVTFPLSDPYRVVIDLAEVRFALPATAGQSGRGLVSAFRYGLFSPGKSRIVVDLTAPVRIDRTFVTEPGEGQPARVVVEMVPTSRESFLAAVRAYRDGQSFAAAQRLERPFDAPSLPLRRTVVLDPGHGGIDLGARGKTGTLEKDIALAFARALADKLDRTGRYEVLMTRSDDSFVSLGERVAFAQEHGADLFLSIHANSFVGPAVRGAAVYTLCEQACDADASRTAMSENQSDILAGIDVAAEDSDEVRDILSDLTRRETRNFGVAFALNLVRELKGSSTVTFKEPHQEANFKVLTAPDVPSALIELGFLSNAADERLLASGEWQDSTAESMVRAVDAYFSTRVAGMEGGGSVVAQRPR
jgi:N-acetylmuramoyl-L-alanine amidase